MIKEKTISLVIPCRNEEHALTTLFKKVPACVDEVLVIDNNSTDNTAQVALDHGAKVFQEVRQVNGIGYGYAHQLGLDKAQGDILVTMDGDNTYPLKSIKSIVAHLIDNKLDFISCSRFPLEQHDAISPLRILGVKLLNLETRLLYNYPIKDILSGMWVVRKNIVPQLKLKEGGWNLSPEIKLTAIVNPELKFAEHHISHTYRYDNESKQQIWQTGFEHLLYIAKRRLTQDNPLTSLASRLIMANKTRKAIGPT